MESLWRGIIYLHKTWLLFRQPQTPQNGFTTYVSTFPWYSSPRRRGGASVHILSARACLPAGCQSLPKEYVEKRSYHESMLLIWIRLKTLTLLPWAIGVLHYCKRLISTLSQDTLIERTGSQSSASPQEVSIEAKHA